MFLPDNVLDHLRTAAAPAAGDAAEHPRYALLEPIGAGGMGTVYRALDRALGREVALKVTRAGPAGNAAESTVDAELAERLAQEARVIARLEHPGIVPVHDVGRLPSGQRFYVMKLVRGQRLDERFADVGPLAERLRVFERVCEAVAFAHAHGVIHRDLKPQNVMVGEFGEVLVLDWGIARLERPPQTSGSGKPARSHGAFTADSLPAPETRLGAVMGTPAYMAPEQARGAADEIDERTDVFGLGGVLYFLLTASPPRGRDDTATRRANDIRLYESPRRLNPAVPRPLTALCLRALNADRQQRYPSAAALAADVARFRNGEPVTAYREPALERVRRVAWKYRTPIGLVLAYILMRALLVFTGWW